MSNNPNDLGERAHTRGVVAAWRDVRAGIEHIEEALSAYEEASGGLEWEDMLSLLVKVRAEVGLVDTPVKR